MLYVIVTGGPLQPQAATAIKAISGSAEDTVIIACDSGTDFLASHGIIPDMVVGDMDSISESGLEFIQKNNIFTEKYPVEKDWTDTEIALNKTQDDEVVLVCPVTGRIDHVIANLGLALKLKSQGKSISITDGVTYCYPLYGEDSATADVTRYNGNAAVSLIPCDFSNPVTGVTTEGLYYPLADAELNFGSSFSFSNKPLGNADSIRVSIRSGLLLLVVTNAIQATKLRLLDLE